MKWISFFVIFISGINIVFGQQTHSYNVTVESPCSSNSLNEIGAQLFLVSPNPIENKMIISSKSYPFEIKFFDVQGRVLLQKFIDENYIEIENMDLPSGMYMIQFIDAKRFYTTKIIKK